jgi:simple sugar transport system ATP-binding protein
MIQRFDIRAFGEDTLVKDLSGGNQQKVILARELHGSPSVLIANQPTRGVDIHATMNIRREIIESRNNGTAVLLVSADLEEIIQVSDRIAVIYNGKIMGILPGRSSVADIGPLMLGERMQEDGEATSA